MCHAQSQHHLILPQRNRIVDCGLDFFRHQGVVVLNKTNLGSHLDADGTGKLQIVKLLFKAVAHGCKVVGDLRVLCLAGGLCLFPHSGQRFRALLIKLLFACQNIHREFLEICKVGFVHLIQHYNVLKQPVLMFLQFSSDFINIYFRFVITCF